MPYVYQILESHGTCNVNVPGRFLLCKRLDVDKCSSITTVERYQSSPLGNPKIQVGVSFSKISNVFRAKTRRKTADPVKGGFLKTKFSEDLLYTMYPCCTTFAIFRFGYPIDDTWEPFIS